MKQDNPRNQDSIEIQTRSGDTAVKSKFNFDLSEVLENLYNINKHAKKYKRLGTENYRKDKKTTAKANSLKKEALYSLKEEILKEIKDEVEKANIHIIDNNKFYCLYFDDYTFHIPINKININEEKVEKTEVLDNFESGEEKKTY